MAAQETRQASTEITAEMARAGGQVIFENPSLCEDGWDELAVEVYEAMESARRHALKRHKEAKDLSYKITGDLDDWVIGVGTVQSPGKGESA